MTNALIPIATGTEELEVVTIIDIFRRAGWRTVCAACNGTDEPASREVVCSRGVRLIADCFWVDVSPQEFEVLALAGGAEGARRLSLHAGVLQTVRDFTTAGKVVGAVCAAPLVLQAAGVLTQRIVTCHPSVRDKMIGMRVTNDRVVTDGRLVTSQGPGTAMEFSLRLVRLVDGPAAADAIAEGLIMPRA